MMFSVTTAFDYESASDSFKKQKTKKQLCAQKQKMIWGKTTMSDEQC